jgi:hypothetical protein
LKNKILKDGSMPYNPDDPTIWYNKPDIKKIVLELKEKLGEPVFIAKDGSMRYPHFLILTEDFCGGIIGQE